MSSCKSRTIRIPDERSNLVSNNDHDNTVGLGAGKDLNYVETAEGRLIDAKA